MTSRDVDHWLAAFDQRSDEMTVRLIAEMRRSTWLTVLAMTCSNATLTMLVYRIARLDS